METNFNTKLNIMIEEKQITELKNNYGRILKNKYEEYTEDQLNFLNELLGSGKSFDYSKEIKAGDIITARVGGETASHYLFDIDGKDFIYVEKRKAEMEALCRYLNEDTSTIDSTTEVKLQITSVQESPYHLITGSLSVLEKALTMNEYIEDETPVLGKIVSVNPAGAVIEITDGVSKTQAFCPAYMCGLNRLTPDQLQTLLGGTYYFIIESYSETQGTYIVSRKAYLQQLIPDAISKLVTRNEAGELIPLTGTITGSSQYGIFVELENHDGENILTGMIHNSTLNDKYKDLLNRGEVEAGSKIEFFVKEIIDTKIVLVQTIKETLWDIIKVGDIFNKVVVKDVKNIGFLVELDKITKGLINPNESSKVAKPIEQGDVLDVKVVSVNRNIRKIFLSIV
jgi:ribosomal protein S1